MKTKVKIPKELRQLPIFDNLKLKWEYLSDNTLALLKPECDLCIKHHVWIDRRGKRYHVKNMTSTHIRNCIKCFNGYGKSVIPDNYLGGKDKWLEIFHLELLSRN